MIGRLVGRLVTDDVDGTILIDVNGVGYELTVPLGAVGRARGSSAGSENLTLFVHTLTREDRLELFGFSSELERRVFRLLLTLPKLGPKLAIAVLSSLPPSELASAVGRGDVKRLSKINGVGKKTAERLVLELKEKLPRLGSLTQPAATEATPTSSDDEARLVGALTNMGYKPAEAQTAVTSLKDRLGSEPISDLLRAALSELA
jgi:Holliday junction DNA helicase RuvA